ncbi:MAG: transcription termination/antitermination protein NusA, partial [Anaerococcus sp.]|nr:transcription termination/antitermination protein NusA [Peptoniphilaceae bacterium]MDY3055539.1 transcription termination/antitermination protein NusA [Anaerococcus sp.]
GQNARLAARLTGWKIDIKSEEEYESLSQEEIDEILGLNEEEEEVLDTEDLLTDAEDEDQTEDQEPETDEEGLDENQDDLPIDDEEDPEEDFPIDDEDEDLEEDNE